jgi:hypothetical protein
MTITINGSGTVTGASTLATTVASPTFTTPNIDSAQFATVSGTAPIYPCRAWVNFNGTGTVAIRASGNVSSITDNGVGVYTMNFTTAMFAANYSVVAAGQQDNAATDLDSTGKVVSPQSLLVSSVKLCSGWFGNQRDFETVEVAVFR